MMNILLFDSNEFRTNEYLDFFENHNLVLSSDKIVAISEVSKHKFDLAILCINNFSELGLLKYINENHPSIEVILSLSEHLNEVLSILIGGDFHHLKLPITLNRLKKIIKTKMEVVK